MFCITDLLPHLGAKQSAKTLAEGITAEDLNVIIASLPIEDKDAEQRVKLNVLGMLNEAYGITERDFTRAEIEIVPDRQGGDRLRRRHRPEQHVHLPLPAAALRRAGGGLHHGLQGRQVPVC